MSGEEQRRAPKRVDNYVAAVYTSADGVEKVLSFERRTTLADMQRQLCSSFRKNFPAIEVGLLCGDRTWDEFLQQPLLKLQEGQRISVVFYPTTNPHHYDRADRLRGKKTLEEEMREAGELE